MSSCPGWYVYDSIHKSSKHVHIGLRGAEVLQSTGMRHWCIENSCVGEAQVLAGWGVYPIACYLTGMVSGGVCAHCMLSAISTTTVGYGARYN